LKDAFEICMREFGPQEVSVLQQSYNEGNDGAVGLILNEFCAHKDHQRLMGDLQGLAVELRSHVPINF
jgi:hypothetical protein